MVTSNTGAGTSTRKAGPLGCLIIAAFIVLTMGSISYFVIYPTWNARLNGIQTQGAVTNVVVCPDDGGDTVIRPYLAQDSSDSVTAEIIFTDQRGHKQDVWENNCDNYTQGQTVTLWYLPNDPQTFTTEQQLTGTIIAAAVMSIFVGPSALVLLIALLRLFLFLPTFLLGSARQSRQPQPAYAVSVYQPPSVVNAGYSGPSAANAYTPATASPQLAPPTARLAYRVGQTAEIDNLCAATLTRVTTSSNDPGALPLPGQVYLLVNVALRNRSSQPLDAYSAGQFQLWDTQGHEYQPTLLSGTVFYLTGIIEPGKREDQQLAFSVPDTIHAFRLTFQRDRSGAPLATWEITI